MLKIIFKTIGHAFNSRVLKAKMIRNMYFLKEGLSNDHHHHHSKAKKRSTADFTAHLLTIRLKFFNRCLSCFKVKSQPNIN